MPELSLQSASAPIWASLAALVPMFLFIPSADLTAAACGDGSVAAIVKCALENDPGLQQHRAAWKGVESELPVSDSLEDPVLAGESLSAEGGGQSASLELKQALPLNGIGDRKRKEAQARSAVYRTRYEIARQELVSSTMHDILRLRQIDHEAELVRLETSLAEKALERLSRLAALTAEQAASKKTFVWNRAALAKRLASLTSETETLRDAITARLGGAAPSSWGFVESYQPLWPEWPAASGVTPLPQALAWAELQAAKAGLGIENAQSWPAPSVAGRMNREGADGVQTMAFGLGVEFALPVFNRNRQARARAGAEELQARLWLEAVERAVKRERALLEAKYRRGTAALAGSEEEGLAWRRELESIQATYLSGRLPVAAALEATRQLVDAVEAAHTIEMQTAESLWGLRVLDGSAEDAVLGPNTVGGKP